MSTSRNCPPDRIIIWMFCQARKINHPAVQPHFCGDGRRESEGQPLSVGIAFQLTCVNLSHGVVVLLSC